MPSNSPSATDPKANKMNPHCNAGCNGSADEEVVTALLEDIENRLHSLDVDEAPRDRDRAVAIDVRKVYLKKEEADRKNSDLEKRLQKFKDENSKMKEENSKMKEQISKLRVEMEKAAHCIANLDHQYRQCYQAACFWESSCSQIETAAMSRSQVQQQYC